jgi:hypothetical protein
MKKLTTSRIVTFVIAPDIPAKECKMLRKLWDSRSKIVVNYDLIIKMVAIPRGDRLVVTAPDISVTELKVLRAHVKKALTDPDYYIITNYDLSVSTITNR